MEKLITSLEFCGHHFLSKMLNPSHYCWTNECQLTQIQVDGQPALTRRSMTAGVLPNPSSFYHNWSFIRKGFIGLYQKKKSVYSWSLPLFPWLGQLGALVFQIESFQSKSWKIHFSAQKYDLVGLTLVPSYSDGGILFAISWRNSSLCMTVVNHCHKSPLYIKVLKLLAKGRRWSMTSNEFVDF